MGLLEAIWSRVSGAHTVAIARARPGERATVRGVVVPRDLIDSPLTGERCVYYQYTVELWRRPRVPGVGGDGFWEVAELDEAIAEFYVDDGTARAIIAPAEARVSRGRGIELEHVDAEPGQRAQQLILRPGDRVAVTGEIARAPDLLDEGRAYREPAERVVVRAPADAPLRIQLLGRAR